MTDKPLPTPADQTAIARKISLNPCQRTGCPKFATAALVMLVPFTGKHVNEMEPLQLFIGYELCHEHGREAKVTEFINPGMESAVIRACIEQGRPRPDFGRAIMGARPLDDPKYLAYQAAMAVAKGQAQ